MSDSEPEALLNLWPHKAKRTNPLEPNVNNSGAERRTLELLDSLATALVSEPKSEAYAVGYCHEVDSPPIIYITGNENAVPEKVKTHALDIVERLSTISATITTLPRHTKISEDTNIKDAMYALHLCITSFTFPKYKHNVLKRDKRQWNERRELCTSYLATQSPENLVRFSKLSTQISRVRTAMLYDDEDGAVILVPSLSGMMDEDGMNGLVKELDRQVRAGASFPLACFLCGMF